MGRGLFVMPLNRFKHLEFEFFGFWGGFAVLPTCDVRVVFVVAHAFAGFCLVFDAEVASA